MTMKAVYNVINNVVCAETRGGVRSRYVGNAIGSTMALLNTSQAISDSWKYSPYGEVTRVTGSTATKLLFVGGASCRQDNSMNTYMQNRVLDVVKGKWKTQDPIRFAGRDWNLYRCVANRPTSLVDRSGYVPCSPQGLPNSPGMPPPPNIKDCLKQKSLALCVDCCNSWGNNQRNNVCKGILDDCIFGAGKDQKRLNKCYSQYNDCLRKVSKPLGKCIDDCNKKTW